MSKRKAYYYLAKYHSLSTAAEFIRSHGEEGFSYGDEKLDIVYKRENQKLADQLNVRASIFYAKYKSLDIFIESIVDDNY